MLSEIQMRKEDMKTDITVWLMSCWSCEQKYSLHKGRDSVLTIPNEEVEPLRGGVHYVRVPLPGDIKPFGLESQEVKCPYYLGYGG
jgi:hypothetical protein